MALDAAQQQFASAPIATPGLDKMTAGAGQGLDAVLNGAIEKVGGAMDAATSEVKGMGKQSVANLGGSSLAGDPGSMPSVSPGKGQDLPSQGQSKQISKEVGPEMQKAITQAQGTSNGMKTEHVTEADLGAIAPTSVSAGMAQTQSQGMSI